MEIKIGIQHAPRELTIETESSAAEIERHLAEAVESDGLFVVSDAKGRKVLVPAARVAYIDLGQENSRRVGFGTV